MMIISYNLMKRRTLKKFEKPLKILKMYNIINLETIHYKLTALGKVILAILKYKLMRPFRFYGYLKNKRNRLKQQTQNKLSEKKCGSY